MFIYIALPSFPAQKTVKISPPQQRETQTKKRKKKKAICTYIEWRYIYIYTRYEHIEIYKAHFFVPPLKMGINSKGKKTKKRFFTVSIKKRASPKNQSKRVSEKKSSHHEKKNALLFYMHAYTYMAITFRCAYIIFA